MDYKGKLTKASRKYHIENYYADDTRKEDIISAFKDGAEWLQSQPLAERLTEDEREYVQNLHKALNEFIASGKCREFFAYTIVPTISFIESIFGKEMFNNE